MNQCVPSWDLEDPPNLHPHLLPSTSSPQVSTSSYCEVAELTWENGHLAKHGLGQARVGKPVATYPTAAPAAAWEKPRASGTLEAVVNQATRAQLVPPSSAEAIAAWIRGGSQNPGAPVASVDALVPCSNRESKRAREGSWNCGSQGSRKGENTQVTDTCDMISIDGFTNTSATQSRGEVDGSPDTENTSVGGHDSASRSRRSLRGVVCDEEKKATKGETRISSISTKRSRVAATHNQSERIEDPSVSNSQGGTRMAN